MMKYRAEILDTQIPLYFKAQIEINAPANKIFDFISRPNNHPLMDGSGMVKGKFRGPNPGFRKFQKQNLSIAGVVRWRLLVDGRRT